MPNYGYRNSINPLNQRTSHLSSSLPRSPSFSSLRSFSDRYNSDFSALTRSLTSLNNPSCLGYSGISTSGYNSYRSPSNLHGKQKGTSKSLDRRLRTSASFSNLSSLSKSASLSSLSTSSSSGFPVSISTSSSPVRSRSSSRAKEEDDKDYKKLYEELLVEMDNLKKEYGKKESDWIREKRHLERKLSELEEEVKQMESIKNDNQRLKDENAALIRVITESRMARRQ